MRGASAPVSVGAHVGGHSIVALDKFIQATRDSGYKGTSNAVAELVDNSLQAGAERIDIYLLQLDVEARFPIEVFVCDDGSGMSPEVLRQALRFGGSSRFNDRSGLGRYGMGLPNSSLSQAKTVTVFSWTSSDEVFSCYLDVEEIAAGSLVEVPVPQRSAHPLGQYPTQSGTVVSWSQCDRLDNKRVSTLERKLAAALGRRFRHFLWRGASIRINDVPLRPIDPLYLNSDSLVCGAAKFGQTLTFEVRVDPDSPSSASGEVHVTFSELPVASWFGLSNQEKRGLGITKGAGVSVVRGEREVDYGWLFMGTKRRENYDDWWRCEIRFDPVLDEAFGVTHTKQQVRPQAHLLEALVPDLEGIARALNQRARRAYMEAKRARATGEGEAVSGEPHTEGGPPECHTHSGKADGEDPSPVQEPIQRSGGPQRQGQAQGSAPIQQARRPLLDLTSSGAGASFCLNLKHPLFEVRIGEGRAQVGGHAEALIRVMQRAFVAAERSSQEGILRFLEDLSVHAEAMLDE